MKNNKGFSLVELLAVVVILGILSGVAVIAYSRYSDRAKVQAFDTLASSAASAAEEYIFDHPGADEVSLADLVEQQYLENIKDAGDKSKDCSGKVKITSPEESGDGETLDEYKYEVYLCCTLYNYKYTYPGKSKEVIEGCS